MLLGVLLMGLSSRISAPSFEELVKTDGVIQGVERIELAGDLPHRPAGAALELKLHGPSGVNTYWIVLLSSNWIGIESLAIGQRVSVYLEAASPFVWQVERDGETLLAYRVFHDRYRVWRDKWLWSGAIASNIGLVSLLVSFLFWRRAPITGEVQRE